METIFKFIFIPTCSISSLSWKKLLSEKKCISKETVKAEALDIILRAYNYTNLNLWANTVIQNSKFPY